MIYIVSNLCIQIEKKYCFGILKICLFYMYVNLQSHALDIFGQD